MLLPVLDNKRSKRNKIISVVNHLLLNTFWKITRGDVVLQPLVVCCTEALQEAKQWQAGSLWYSEIKTEQFTAIFYSAGECSSEGSDTDPYIQLRTVTRSPQPHELTVQLQVGQLHEKLLPKSQTPLLEAICFFKNIWFRWNWTKPVKSKTASFIIISLTNEVLLHSGHGEGRRCQPTRHGMTHTKWHLAVPGETAFVTFSW